MVHFDDKALDTKKAEKTMTERQKSALSVIFEVMDSLWKVRIGCIKRLSLEWSSTESESVIVNAEYFGSDCELESLRFRLEFVFDRVNQVSEHQVRVEDLPVPLRRKEVE